MRPRVSAFRWVPPFAQGLVRDLRVRWALLEAGRDYDELLIGFNEPSSEEYRLLQPFGQVPAYLDEELTLFESGAIVLHIAESCSQLLPTEFRARARAKAWMFAALNTVEPPILFLNRLQQMDVAEDNEIRKAAVSAVNRRLGGLAAWLGEQAYLEGRFTAGDLLMASVLRILRSAELLVGFPTLVAYQHRCEAREAFQRALSDQLRTFQQHQPAASR
jgi:glutathione S-transferase